MAAILGPGGLSMAAKAAVNGPGGPSMAGDHLRRDRTIPDPFSRGALILQAITPLHENRVWPL